MVGLMATSSKRAYAIPKSAAPSSSLLLPESLPLWQSTADLYLHKRHSNTVLSQSLWSLWVLVHTRFVGVHWASLAGMGFDSKGDFTPPTVLLGFLLCPWTCFSFFFFFFFFMGSNIILSTVVQQQVVILEFLQEKMSSPPATLPSNAL